jgi:2-C-methyl-D-erythritol 4-phosphate cytidylyltransferase
VTGGATADAFAVALVLAYGQGERLGKGEPKALVALAGRPLLSWSLAALANARRLRGAIVVGDPARVAPVLAALPAPVRARVLAVVAGGATRQESCARGLALVADDVEVVLVHDAARPFADAALFDAVADAARAHGAALAAHPLADTLKRVDGDRVVATVERAGLWQAQTPQGARRKLFVEAHEAAARDGVTATDDVALLERLGTEVRVVPAPSSNRKITTAEDLAWAESWARALSTDEGART